MRRFLLVLVLLLGCAGVRTPPVAVEPTDTAKCPEACAHLAKLGCEEAKRLDDGTTCTQFCQITQKQGHALRPACVVTIKSCSELGPKCMTKSRSALE